MREKMAGCTLCRDTAYTALFVGLSWHCKSGIICHDTSHPEFSFVTHHIRNYLLWHIRNYVSWSLHPELSVVTLHVYLHVVHI